MGPAPTWAGARPLGRSSSDILIDMVDDMSNTSHRAAANIMNSRDTSAALTPRVSNDGAAAEGPFPNGITTHSPPLAPYSSVHPTLLGSARSGVVRGGVASSVAQSCGVRTSLESLSALKALQSEVHVGQPHGCFGATAAGILSSVAEAPPAGMGAMQPIVRVHSIHVIKLCVMRTFAMAYQFAHVLQVSG